MKPGTFAYHAPASVDETTSLLGEIGPDASVLAGGQSLVPLLAMRIVRPDHVVDVNGVAGLDGIEATDGMLCVGALVRQQQALGCSAFARACPLVAEALPHVGVRETRVRGTLVGSLTHADPAGELPTAAAALDAELVLRSLGGSRIARATEFFVAPFMTLRRPDELVTEVRFPAARPRAGWAFLEFARGPVAVVAAAAGLELSTDGRVEAARLALGGVGPIPLRATEAEAILRGETASDALFAYAGEIAAAAADPPADILASAAYRRRASALLSEDALRLAAKRASRERT